MASFRIDNTAIEILGDYIHISKDGTITAYLIDEDEFLSQFIPEDWEHHADTKYWWMTDYVTEEAIIEWQIENHDLIRVE